MSARSSSGSWSGTGRAPPDIIDLDRFMRGAVRPARNDAHTLRSGDKLVVDAGGVARKPGALGLALPAPAAHAAPASPLTVPSDSSDSQPRPHGKRFSHDSGLSDTSYARRKHRPHRRAVGGDNNGVRAPRTPAAGSSDSLRAFRAVCERALLDQQAQIARVAQLCERLSERPPPRRRSDRSATDSSDVSSSSRSSRDQRREDKHRTDECKTYKIIMNKLDELNRLFAARARSPPPAARSAPLRLPDSSGSVSVSDKLVATEPECDLAALKSLTIRGAGGSTYGTCGSCGAGAASRTRGLGGAGGAGGSGGAGGGGGAAGSFGAGGSSRLAALSAVTNTFALDIAPREALPRRNIATESVVQCASRAGTATSGGDPRCGFDLDDPVHLYSQAKRLQAMSATTRRARSVEPSARRFKPFEPDEHSQRSQVSQRAHSHGRARAERSREPSLCSLCRGYWRSLTNYLATQIFCCPDAAVR